MKNFGNQALGEQSDFTMIPSRQDVNVGLELAKVPLHLILH